MKREPERHQIATTVQTPLRLGMGIEEIEASEVRILFEGDMRETRPVTTDKSRIDVVLTFHNPGEYCIELVAEEQLSEEMEHLQQQDDLEFSPPKAHAAWDVTVDPAKQQPQNWPIWKVITNLLALRELILIIQNRGGQVWDHLRQSDSSEEEEDVDMTLDEFRKE